jgi:hypothetical protein
LTHNGTYEFCWFCICSLEELDAKMFVKGKAAASVRSEQEVQQTQQVRGAVLLLLLETTSLSAQTEWLPARADAICTA